MESVQRMTKSYRAFSKGNWKDVQDFYEKHNLLVNYPLTPTRDTALHVAVHSQNTELLKSLLEIMKDWPSIEGISPFETRNEYDQTALHAAAATGNLEAVKLLLEYDEKLLACQSKESETALFHAARYGETEVLKFLASKIENNIGPPHLKRKDGTSILHIAILGRNFETAMELLKLKGVHPYLVDGKRMTGFQLLANMPSAFKSGYRMGNIKALLYYCLPEVDYADDDKKKIDSRPGKKEDLESGQRPQESSQAADPSCSVISKAYNTFWRYIARGFPSIKNMSHEKMQQTKAKKLAKILARTDLSWRDSPAAKRRAFIISTTKGDKDDGDGKGHRAGPDKTSIPEGNENDGDDKGPPEIPLFLAARNGIFEIVEAILECNPQAIEHLNKNHENIFHVVAKHHRTEILDLLQSSAVVVPRWRLESRINDKGDSILHNAAYKGTSSSRTRPGEALQMQSDLIWFKRVQKIVPSYFLNHRNNEKKTAHELFTEEHNKMLKDGQEWLTRTSEACSVVAVLIATVAFTCAYTVPGGSNETGHPLLLKTTPFSVFAISDALSLCFSLTSVVVFLSIMTSTMHEQEFRRSLPSKLVFGLTTLFFAVTAMMVAFAATLVLMTRERLHWAAIPIYTVACIPVTIFLILQVPLYLNIAWFTVKDLCDSFTSQVCKLKIHQKNKSTRA